MVNRSIKDFPLPIPYRQDVLNWFGRNLMVMLMEQSALQGREIEAVEGKLVVTIEFVPTEPESETNHEP